MAAEAIEAQRRSVPTSTWVRSECPDGTLMSMNVCIDGTKLDEYIKIVTPVVHKFREFKECMFCEISVHPQDRGHVRILHGWTKPSDWFRDNMESQPWFGEYIKAMVPLLDKTRPRTVEHFDRILIE